MNTILNNDAYSAPISDTAVIAPPPAPVRIPPRTLAKMRDMDYLRLARQRFLEGMPYRTPVEVVEAGVKSIFDWCACLDDARSELGRPSLETN